MEQTVWNAQTTAIPISQITQDDSLDQVLAVVRRQHGPLIFVVPDWGRALSEGGEFALLRQASLSPATICFVIPPSRWPALAGAATAQGFLVAPTVEEAASLLLESETVPGSPLVAAEHVVSAPVQVTAHRRWPGPKQLVVIVALLVLLIGVLGGLLAAVQAPIPPFAVGNFAFLSSGQLNPVSSQGLNDVIKVELHGVAAPVSGEALYAWLEPDPGQDNIRPILLGKLQVVQGQAGLTYVDQEHADLLATYSRFLITQQDSSQVPITPAVDPSTHLYQGAIPNIPRPGDEKHYSLLSHLRHLLAQDPTVESIGLAGGLNVWLFRNSQMVLEESTTARDYWKSGGVAYMHRQIVRILDYLDGYNYVWRDVPAGTPFLIDRLAGQLGLLTFDPTQTPPGYIAHVSLHLDGLVNSPGATTGQQTLARYLDAALASQVTSSYTRVRTDAMQLAKMNSTQLRTPGALALLDDMASYANAAFAGPGPFGQQAGGQGVDGILTAMASLAVIPVEEG